MEPRWYEREKNGVGVKNLPPPYENIVIGSDPRDGMTKEYAGSFEVLINVSDSCESSFDFAYPWQKIYWYPINEMGYWGYASFFWFKRTMDKLHDKGRKPKIYVHCHAGIYRSPSMVESWIVSNGKTWAEANEIIWGRGLAEDLLEKRMSRYFNAGGILHGNCPKHLDEFFKLMNEHPTWALAGIMNALRPREYTREFWGSHLWDIFWHEKLWFYYKPKWWLIEQRRYTGYRLMGMSITRDGPCTNIKAPEEGFCFEVFHKMCPRKGLKCFRRIARKILTGYSY